MGTQLSELSVKMSSIEPGSPWENGYVESFNGKLWDELLNVELFDTLREAQVLVERWRKRYNTVRPRSALGCRPAPEARQPSLEGCMTATSCQTGTDVELQVGVKGSCRRLADRAPATWRLRYWDALPGGALEAWPLPDEKWEATMHSTKTPEAKA